MSWLRGVSGFEVMKTSVLATMAHMVIATRPTSQIFGSKQMSKLSSYFQLLTINRLQSALQNFSKANADGALQASSFLKSMTDDESEMVRTTCVPLHC